MEKKANEWTALLSQITALREFSGSSIRRVNASGIPQIRKSRNGDHIFRRARKLIIRKQRNAEAFTEEALYSYVELDPQDFKKTLIDEWIYVKKLLEVKEAPIRND